MSDQNASTTPNVWWPPSADETRKRARFARDVKAGLTAEPKRLPCKYLYDAAGTDLFERICATPEYYLTRLETEILSRSVTQIADELAPPLLVFELGSGSAVKTELLLSELLERQHPLGYVPMDISRTALLDSSHRLRASHVELAVQPVLAEYEDAACVISRSSAYSKLVLWLGSSIGNLDRASASLMLARLALGFGTGDHVLVGIDLRKSAEELLPAYDDSARVTAAFNLNLLGRINRELDGRFVLEAFHHRASYDEVQGRVDMHLVSRKRQTVRIGAAGLEVKLARDETIHTESSYKYSQLELDTLAAGAGLRVHRCWTDEHDRYALILLGRS